MVIADTELFVALVKEDDWLQDRALNLLDEYEGEIRTGLPTFIELFFLFERYGVDRDRALSNILAIVETDVAEDLLFQASEYVSQGLDVFDAFQAAGAEGRIISSDQDFDRIAIERLPLER